MKQQIKEIFTNLEELKENGIYFSGIEGWGEFKRWWKNGRLYTHFFYLSSDATKNKNVNKEYKRWWNNGKLWVYYTVDNKGEKHGEYKAWDVRGNLIEHEKWKHGKKIMVKK